MRTVVVMTIGNADAIIKRLDAALMRSVMEAIAQLQENPFAGDHVRKQQIPRELKHLPNLWRMELAKFWRMLYYIASDERHTRVIIFEICNHKQYERIFKY